MSADLRAQGIPESQVRMMVADMKPETSLTLPMQFEPAIRLASATAGQWRMAGGGFAPLRPVAIDLGALDVAARWLEITPSPKLHDHMMIIESEALKQMRQSDG